LAGRVAAAARSRRAAQRRALVASEREVASPVLQRGRGRGRVRGRARTSQVCCCCARAASLAFFSAGRGLQLVDSWAHGHGTPPAASTRLDSPLDF
jgi:hypothetical protein